VPPDFPAGGDPATSQSFHTTHWSVVLVARDQSGPGAKEALAKLCSTYWYPLYAFIRRNGFSPHDAQDLTQEFFYDFLERDSLRNVAPAGGKFRSYLLASLKHFLSNRKREQHAQKRGAGVPIISLDGLEADTRYLTEPANTETPEILFERRWAWTVLEQTTAELQREYAQRAAGEMFDDLRGFLSSTQATASRAELAAKYGITAGAIDVAIHRLRQRFGVLLREQILRTVSSPAEVEEELRYLMSLF